MLYIQNKLDELIETYRKETGFTEYDVRMIAERLVADYHNHIVEKVKNKLQNFIKDYNEEGESYAIDKFLSLLQDTNPKK